MQLSYTPYHLNFKHLFGVSGNLRTQTTSVFVKIEEEALTGYGEACLPEYLGETERETIQFLEKALPILKGSNTNTQIEDILTQIDALDVKCNAAKASIDMALCDLFSKKANQSFSQWKGLKQKKQMPTSFTIGIDSEEKIIQKINEAKDFQILKIKAGTKNDKALISLIRQHTNKPLYLDINQGWQDKIYALEMIEWLSDKNITLIEQPLPKEQKEEMKWLTARSPIATFADESVKRLKDLEELDGAFTGINIKLMKCTGLIEALKMIQFCQTHQIKMFLGCMAESSCATSAMAQLMAYADFVDLDAPQLYLNDPFDGVSYKNGEIILNDLNGIGASPNSLLHF
jgi:L-alanine-DL-glutamate epimerase-like enolase superfamily enzyme